MNWLHLQKNTSKVELPCVWCNKEPRPALWLQNGQTALMGKQIGIPYPFFLDRLQEQKPLQTFSLWEYHCECWPTFALMHSCSDLQDEKSNLLAKKISGLKFHYLEMPMKVIQLLQGLGPKSKWRLRLLLTQPQKRKLKEKGLTVSTEGLLKF